MNGASEQERRILEEAELERLIANAMATVDTSSARRTENSRAALRRFRDEITTFLDLQKKADRAIATVNAAQVDESRRQLAAIAEELSDSGEVFAAAATIARSGKASLLFPRLAATASSTLELIKEFQKAADRIRESDLDIDGLNELKTALSTVKDSLNTLKAKAEAISSAASGADNQ